MDAHFGRFCDPVERPFNQTLPPPHRKVVMPDSGLAIDDYEQVNLTDEIFLAYLKLLPNICPPGDDNQYGSSTEHDVYALQAIARRIHYGAFFVGESKFRAMPRRLTEMVEAGDKDAIWAAITRHEVERNILERVAEKVTYIQAKVNEAVRHVVSPDVVLTFYRDVIIPLTKDGQVLYLFHRHKEERSNS
mgnify:CR=1 FL=1